MRKLLFVLAFSTYCFNVLAQINTGGIPLGYKAKYSLDIPLIQLPFVNETALKAEDRLNDNNKNIPYRFGFMHQVDYTPATQGVWKTLANGYQLWQLQVTSKGALTLNFIFSQFHLPEGSTLYIYNSTHTDVLGAFTSRNNSADGAFGTVLLNGESAIIEYAAPPYVKETPGFHITGITHGYRTAKEFVIKSFGGSGNCNINVNCPISNGWDKQKRSVALILVGGSAWCTGSLLNDVPQDTIPYFMTANHCYQGGVGTWQFIFNWESPGCASTIIPMQDIINGATLMAKSSFSDFCLLRLNQKVPASFHPYFNGWDRTNNIPDSVVGIHHPSGDIKKISLAMNSCQDSSYAGAFCWKVGQWTAGVTEGGSSGSPLFNKYKKFVGQLYGGPSSCGVPDSEKHDYYGKFSYSWNGDTAAQSHADIFLDPALGNTFTLNGFDPFVNTGIAANDAAIVDLVKPLRNVITCGDSLHVTLQIANRGSNSFNQLEIYQQIDNGAAQLYNWSGATLNTNYTAIIQLPVLQSIGFGLHQIHISIQHPNGLNDTNPANDTLTITFNRVSGIPLQLTMHTDDYGDETTWKLFDSGNNLLFTGGPYPQQTGGGIYIENGICVPSGCYKFFVYDASGDGMCCAYGNGSFSLIKTSDGTVLASGGQFGAAIEKDFCAFPDGVIAVTTAPISIYPNPTSSQLHIRNAGFLPLNQWFIVDVLGRSTPLTCTASANTELLADLSGLSNGVYFIKNGSYKSNVLVIEK